MMTRASWPLATLAAACVFALAACSKQVDSNATAPGNPGTGNTAEVVRPAAPDGPPGGPSGIAGSAPHTGSSGGDAVPGTTGQGTADASGHSQTAQPGTGLHGGLGSGTAMGASGANAPAVGEGSANTTPGSAVGTRP
jgi:hypothetical protein